MSTPQVIHIAAVARNGVIGDGAAIPWHVPADFAHFKATTTGHPMIMGRATFEATGVLPGRRSIVLTRNPGYVAEGADVVTDLDAALALAAQSEGGEETYVIGGGEIYRLSLEATDVLLISEIDEEAVGSVTYPPIDPEVWRESAREPRDGFTLVTYTRRMS